MIDKHHIELCKNIMRQTAVFQKEVDKKISDGNTIILFIGNTGSGKSTLVNLLTGKRVLVEKMGVRYCKLVGDGIGDGGRSETQYPAFFPYLHSVLIDLPGFLDTRGVEKEILNRFRLFKLLDKKNGKKIKVKIICVVKHDEIRAVRGGSLNGMIDQVGKMFPYVSNNDHIRVAITGCGGLTIEDNEYKSELLEKFRDKTFFFPMPEREDIGKIYDTMKTHFDNLKSFIISDNGYLSDPEVNISLDHESKLFLSEAQKTQVNVSKIMLQEIFDLFENECAEGFQSEKEATKGIEYLNNQLEIVENLKKSDDNFQYFYSNLLSYAKSENLKKYLTKIREQVTLVHDYAIFIETALGSEEIKHEFKETRIKGCDTLIIKLKSMIEAAKSNENIRKVMEEFREKERKGREEIEYLKRQYKDLSDDRCCPI